MDYLEDPLIAADISSAALIFGFLAAFLAGLVACSGMIKIVRRGKLIYFAMYCFVIGTISAIYHFL